MFCGFCGKQIRDDAVFCSFCGRQVRSLTETPLPDAEWPKQAEKEPFEKTPGPKQRAVQAADQDVSAHSGSKDAAWPRSVAAIRPEPTEAPKPLPPLSRQDKVCDFAFVPKEWGDDPISDTQPGSVPSPQPGIGADRPAVKPQMTVLSEEAKKKAMELGGAAKEQAVKLGVAAKDKTADGIRMLQTAPLKRIEKHVFPIVSVASKVSLLLILFALFAPYCRIAYSAERAANMPLWKLIAGGTYTMGSSNPLQFSLTAHPELICLLLIPLMVLLPLLFGKARGKRPITCGILTAAGLMVLIWNASVLHKIRNSVSDLSLEVFKREVVSMNSVMIKWVQNVIAGNLSFQNTFFVTGKIGHALFALFGWLTLLMGIAGLLLYFLRASLPEVPLPEQETRSRKVGPDEVNEGSEEDGEDDVPELTGDML